MSYQNHTECTETACLVFHGLHGGPVLLAGDAAAVELVVRPQHPLPLHPRLGREHEPVVLAYLLSWSAIRSRRLSPPLYIPTCTFLDVPVGDTDDALAAVAAHEVGVAAVVEQRQRRVDGRAQRNLILKEYQQD